MVMCLHLISCDLWGYQAASVQLPCSAAIGVGPETLNVGSNPEIIPLSHLQLDLGYCLVGPQCEQVYEK